MKSNTILYAKQGFKAIAKNKFQLIIVLILATLFSFYFSSWYAINTKLHETYNSVVETYEKPNAVWSEKIAQTTNAIDESQDQYIPLYDLIMHDGSDNQYLTFDNSSKKVTSPNFLLTDSLNGRQTFITKTFTSNIFKKIFINFFLSNEDATFYFSPSQYCVLATTYNFNKNTGDAMYGLNDESATLDPSLGMTKNNLLYQNFISATTLLLTQNYLLDVKAKADYLQDTTFFKYLQQDAASYQKVMSDNNYDISENNFKESFKKWNNRVAFLNNNGNTIDSFMYNALETLPVLILSNINNFFTTIYNNFTTTTNSIGEDFVDEFNKNFSKTDNPQLRLSASESLSTENVVQNMETSYEYIFGSQLVDNTIAKSIGLQSTPTINEIYIIEKQISKSLWKQTITLGEVWKNNFKKNTNPYNGMFGMTNNFSIYLNNDNKITNVNFQKNISTYARVPLKKTFASARGGLEYDVNATSYNEKNILSMHYQKIKMLSAINNIKFSFREEGYTYDSVSKMSYRFIVLDKNNFSFKLLAGSKIIAANDIYVSEQYARNHNTKVGSSMQINGKQLFVSGTATDALSYFPFADIENPTVDANNTCIVFLTKETLQNIFAYDKGDGLKVTMSNNYFLTSAKNNLKNFQKQNIWAVDDLSNHSSKKYMTDFDKSNWNLTWEVMPKIFLALNIIGVISFVAIIAMIVTTMIIVIRKNILQNKNQLLNLKMQGASPSRIAVSYLWYGFFIMLVAFPLGYIIGSFVQNVVVVWFSTYATVNVFNLTFNYETILILIFGFGMLILFLSYIATFFIVKKLRMSAKKKNKISLVEKIKIPFGFSTNLKFKIAWKGKWEILVFSLLTLLSSLLMSSFTYTLSSVKKYITESSELVAYQNGYTLQQPPFNSPFARPSLSSWLGPDALEKTSIDNLGDEQNLVATFYGDTDVYNQSVNNASVLPSIVYDKGELKWSDDFVFDNYNVGTTFKLLMFFLNAFINNAANVSNKAISIGTFEAFENYLLHTPINPTNGKLFDDDNAISPARKDLVQQFNSLFNSLIPTLLKTFFGSEDFEIEDTSDWREMLLSIARQLLPNSFANYYSTNSRKSQFYFSMNAENYVPGKESLGTVINVLDVNRNQFVLTGLDKDQKVYNLNEKQQAVFVDAKNINALYQNLTHDITNDGIKIYDASTKTLSIPLVANRTYKKYLSNNVSQDLMPTTKALVLNDDVQTVIPKAAWVYDNRDAARSTALKTVAPNATKEKWLNFSNLNISKFNYWKEFNNDGTLTDNAEFFIDYKVSQDGTVTPVFQPYYNYNNVKLFFPKSVVSNVSQIVKKNSYDVALNRKGTADGTQNLTTWYGEAKGPDEVPSSVIKAWGTSDDEPYLWIAPYNLNYDVNFATKQEGQVNTTDVLGNTLGTWFDDVVKSENGSIIKTATVSSVLPNIKHIKLTLVDAFNSYDHNIAIVDRALLNFVAQYDQNITITAPLTTNGDNLSTYQMGQASVGVYNKKALTDIAKSSLSLANLQKNGYVTNGWFNTKFSTFSEPISLTTGMGGSLNHNVGIGMLFRDGLNSVGSTYQTVDFAGLKLQTMISISDIFFSLGIFVSIGIILIAIMVIMALSDVYTSKYAAFVNIMKIQGYSKANIAYIMSGGIIWGYLGALAIGLAASVGITSLILQTFSRFDVLVTLFVTPWIPIVCIIALTLAIIIGNYHSFKKAVNAPMRIQKYD